MVVGAAIGGTAGVNGSVAVTTLAGTVRSNVQGSSLRSDAGGIEIAADADNDLDIVAGGVAGGGVAGVGATVIVTDLSQRTEASTSGATRLDASGLTAIDASAAQDVTIVGFTGAGGGTAGVAGTVNVLVAKGQTLAGVGAGSQINTQLGGAQQDVRVHAQDSLETTDVLGTAGVGGVAGVGAGADVQVVRSGAIASVGDGATVKAGRDITVEAGNSRDIDSVSIAAAGGGYVGAGAGVSVVSVASGASSQATGSLDNSIRNAQNVARNSGLNGQMGNGFSGSSQLQAGINANQQTISPNDTFLSTPDGTALRRRAGRQRHPGCRPQRHRQRPQQHRRPQRGGRRGRWPGGRRCRRRGDQRRRPQPGGTGRHPACRRQRAHQRRRRPGRHHPGSRPGGRGGLVGLGAAVAVSEKSSQTTARILDGTHITAGGLSVDADLDHALKAQTVGVSAGGVAVGASIATSSSSGQAQALVGKNVQVSAGSLAVDASARSSNNVDAVGVSGGIVAGNAVVATASDRTSARAWVDDGSRVTTQGAIGIRASTDPMTRAFAIGASVAPAPSVPASPPPTSTTACRPAPAR